MIVGIHQPNFVPWIGYFCKIARSDHFLFLDDVQFVRRSFISRNLIKTPQGTRWLTVPVRAKGNYDAPIRDIAVGETRWTGQHSRTLQMNYGRAPYFDEVMERVITSVYDKITPGRTKICSVNVALIGRICDFLEIDTPMTFASEHALTSSSTGRLVDLVRAIGGTTYLSGRGADKYQDSGAFAKASIHLIYNDFEYPSYTQLWGRFQSGLSVLDLLFCCGPDAAGMLREAISCERKTDVPLIVSQGA